jgi:hypothetical protein
LQTFLKFFDKLIFIKIIMSHNLILHISQNHQNTNIDNCDKEGNDNHIIFITTYEEYGCD